MKLLFLAIRTLFYDLDASSLFDDIKNHNNNFISGDFVNLASWTARTFTKSELRSLKDYIMQECKCGKSPKWHHMLNLLHKFATKCLINNEGTPVVVFDKLQEWRELSLLLGEDLLTTAFLASNHKSGGKAPVSFDWPNVISHNNSDINLELEQGLCDTHPYLSAYS